MTDSYIYIIIILLPLTASMVVLQANPYHALIIRGILGAVAAMVYAILGAPDVALTEALVGTMLAITLYAVAVRSSLVMRVGVLTEELQEIDRNILKDDKVEHLFAQLLKDMQKVLREYYMRVELVPYQNREELEQALVDQEIHTLCVGSSPLAENDPDQAETQPYQTKTRIKRLYYIMKDELSGTIVTRENAELGSDNSTPVVTYASAINAEEKH